MLTHHTGQVQRIPKGDDPSFNYPPGGRLANLNKMLTDKIDRLPDNLKATVNEQIKKRAFKRFSLFLAAYVCPFLKNSLALNIR